MPVPSFTMNLPAIDEITGLVTGGVLAESEMTVSVSFENNLRPRDPPPQYLGAFKPIREPIVINVVSGGEAILLPANDVGWNFTNLQWRATVSMTGTNEPVSKWSTGWFDAPVAGVSLGLATVTPVPAAPVVGTTQGAPVDQVHRVANTLVFAVHGADIASPVNIADFVVPPLAYASIAALRAATVSDNMVRILGYYAPGDGGGGVFRWDSTDTTSTDNGGTIITPTSGLSSSGRWKRVYEGAVNTRWFGVNPSQTDNTAMYQKAATWVCGIGIGGILFTPMGWYEFLFDEGTSGLSTITINADNVLILGEGAGTRFSVRNRSAQLARFFTISKSGRGQGGGARDFSFVGGSKLKLGIYTTTWRAAQFADIIGFDMHEGILDFEATDTANYGEAISVERVGHSGISGTTLTQYGVRFRGGSASGAKTWSDCKIDDLDIILCWDAALVLDGVHRFKGNMLTAANNLTSTDTIDGSSKSGCNQAVLITKSASVDCADVSGFHVIDGVYLESLQGSETPANNAAVVIHQTTASTQIQWNKVENIHANGNVSMLNLIDDSGFGRLNNTVFRGNRVPVSGNIIIGAGVDQTDLYLTPDDGRAWDTLISDSGTNTRVNRVAPIGVQLRPPPAVFDSFTAANSSAPDSSKWNNTVGGGAGAAISVQGNALQMTTGATGGYSGTDFVTLSSVLGSTLVDGEIEFCLISSSITVESYLLAGLRSANVIPNAGANAYFLMLAQDTGGNLNAQVIKRVSSSQTTLYTGPSTVQTSGKKTWFRFRVKGTKLMLWTWADGSPVPTLPVWTGTDSGVTGGSYATFALGGGNAAASGIQKIDNAAVYAL